MTPTPATTTAPALIGCREYRGKRSFDVVVAALLLVLAAPLLLVIALAVKAESPGPVLFRQARAGARPGPGGRWVAGSFTLLKFRSMSVGADSSLHEERVRAFVHGVTPSGTGGARFKPADDHRVTRVGRLLRRTSLDEVPQLVNVLRGDMSLVGPRPVPLYEAEQHDQVARQRLLARPGLTGLWQVSGRCDTTFEDMVRLDLEYVQHRSFGLDARVLIKTVPTVVTGRGAA